MTGELATMRAGAVAAPALGAEVMPSTLLVPLWAPLTRLRKAVPRSVEALWHDGSNGAGMHWPPSTAGRLLFLETLNESELSAAADEAERVLAKPVTRREVFQIGAAILSLRPRLGKAWVDGLATALQLEAVRPCGPCLALGGFKAATRNGFDPSQGEVLEAAREAEKAARHVLGIARAAEELHQQVTDWAIDRGLIHYEGADHGW